MTKDRFLFWANTDRLASLSAEVAVKPRGQAPKRRVADAPASIGPRPGQPPSVLSPEQPISSTFPASAPLAHSASEASSPATTSPGGGESEVSFQLPPSGNTEERLQALVEWLLAHARCQKVCVADSEGLELISSGIEPLWIAAVVEVGRQWLAIQSQLDLVPTESLTLRCEEDVHLMVQPSRLGPLSLLFVMPDSETDIPFSRIRQAFTLWIREEEGALSHDT